MERQAYCRSGADVLNERMFWQFFDMSGAKHIAKELLFLKSASRGGIYAGNLCRLGVFRLNPFINGQTKNCADFALTSER